MIQADKLPDSQANLDRCSTVTVFKSKKYLENLQTMDQGVKIKCNAGAIRTNQVGDYGYVSAWFIPEKIANIFLMNKLKKDTKSHTTAGKDTMRCTLQAVQ